METENQNADENQNIDESQKGDENQNVEKNYNLEYLERQVNNLTKLVNINGIINSTLDIKKLLKMSMQIKWLS